VGTSACRPERLVRFDGTLDAVADGLARRRGTLDDALAAYRATCDVELRAPTVDTVEVLRGFGGGLRDFGGWVGGVGRSFEDAIGSGEHDYDEVYTYDDGQVLEYLSLYLDSGADPYRGIPEGAGSWLAAGVGLDHDQDEPPAWIGYLAAGGDIGDVMSPLLQGSADGLARLPEFASLTVRFEGAGLVVYGDEALAAAFSAQLHARVRLPVGQASRLATASTWVGRIGTGMAGVAGAADQWYADAGLPLPERVVRSGTRGAAAAGGSVAGAAIAVGVLCGPGAPACATVAGIAGAFGGSYLADWAVDLLPYMDDPEPAERDLSAVADRIAAPGHVDPGVAATVDLAASDLALGATADDPQLHAEVGRLLPDHDLLGRVLTTGHAHPVPETTPTGTTVPVLPEHDGVPDPWVGARPYE
jgi:hypothetical protein